MAAAMEGLDEIKAESIDLENIPVEEVFAVLKCSSKGLSTSQAEARIAMFGPNKLEEKKESKVLKFLGFMWNPLSWVMEFAAIMAIGLANGDHRPPDWQDFVGIVALLLINSTISFWEENNAGSAAKELMANLAPRTKVLRDGRWSDEDAAVLVPGDIISIKLGDIIPADARLLQGDPLRIDQSALTGECLPVTKYPGSSVYSGSTCKQGEIEAVVTATGVHTFLGKAAHLVDSTNQVGHFQKVLEAIGTFCIASIAVGIFVEIIVMYPIQHRRYRDGIDNLLVLLIGGIPIAMPTVLSVTMAIGSHRLSKQGAITKRMTAIEEMAGMDVLCSDKTGTLTLNKLSVDRELIEVFAAGVEKDDIVLFAARASRVENQDAIDTAMVGMLPDPRKARDGIEEVHFLPFNPVDKRTALTYIDLTDGSWHRVSKGAPEQILDLCNCGDHVRNLVHTVIDKYAERGLRSLAEVPERSKESPGEPWEFVGLLPLLDPPRSDSADTITRALNLGVNVKMITGTLAIAKETGRRLGMGTNMYPSSALLGQNKDEATASIPVDELIEKADGFAGVFPEHKYEIVKKLQEMKHICGMTGDGVNDAPALKKADIGIAVADATDAARNSWKLNEIFATGIVYGTYLAVMTVIFFWAMRSTDFFSNTFHVRSLRGSNSEMMSALYLQVSIISQALIFVTRSRSWCFVERPGFMLCAAFVIAQIVSLLYANFTFAKIHAIGWGWAGVIWLYSFVTFMPLDLFKFAIRYVLSGRAWNNVQNKTAFTTKKNYGREEREAHLHGLPEQTGRSSSSYAELSEIAEQAKRRAEMARFRETSTLRGHLESSAKLRGIDISAVKRRRSMQLGVASCFAAHF
nr:unnamed protein product [Digitaria exilis]